MRSGFGLGGLRDENQLRITLSSSLLYYGKTPGSPESGSNYVAFYSFRDILVLGIGLFYCDYYGYYDLFLNCFTGSGALGILSTFRMQY